MNILKKRILPGVMAGVLAVSMAVPAFATTATTPNNSTTVTGNYVDTPIDVVVDPTGTATVNPYGLPVKIGGTDADPIKISDQQVVTTPLFVRNNSDVDLKVGVSITTTTSGDLSLAATKAAVDTATNKSAFAYMQMAYIDVTDDSHTVASGATGSGTLEVLPSGFTASNYHKSYAAWASEAEYNADADVVLNGSKEVEGTLLTLGATKDGTSSNAGKKVYDATSVGMFRIGGNVVESPKEAWTTKDGFKAVIAFTFKPDRSAAEITGDEKVDKGANITLTLAPKGFAAADIKTVEWGSDDANGTYIKVEDTSASGAYTCKVTGVEQTNASGKNVTVTVTLKNGSVYTGTHKVVVNEP